MAAPRKRITVLVFLLSLCFLIVPVLAQAQFNYVIDSGTITITGYTGSGGAVTIPNAINGLPVTSIGDSAFAYSFGLNKVTIPISVIEIGMYAFRYCTSLNSVEIPNSVISIGAQAFYCCTNLTSLMIGTNLASIGSHSFRYCNSLNAITVDALNPVYSSEDGVLFDKSQTTIIQCPGGKTGNYTIPDSVTNIGPYAFDSCQSLTGIAIPDSVTRIGVAAFHSCNSLTNLTMPNSVTSIGVSAFWSCTNLINVRISTSLTVIAGSAFQDCTSLASVTLPHNISSIGSQAFYRCIKLVEVRFQGNAPSLGSSVFAEANDVTLYYLPGTTGWDLTLGGRPTAVWVLPNPVILNCSPNFGVRTNAFGFIISWATNLPVVVEACTNLTNPFWSSVGISTLSDGWSYFSDPQWTNYPSRLYRLRSP